MKEYSLTVDASNATQRLDVFLTQVLPDVPSRTFIQDLIKKGDVQINQKSVKAHHQVAVGEVVTVRVPEVENFWEGLRPERLQLNIFFEDDVLLVINKPVGMLVHPVHGVNSGTLVNALLHHCRGLSDVNESFRPGIVHRLDRETSGLLVVAKDNRTHVALARQFEEHLVHKKYVALVQGAIEFDEGVVDAPLGRHHRYFDKKMVSFEKNAKEARTFYRVIRRFASQAALIALYPESGRTHQLRVHMAHIGHSILGDDKYGRKDSFPRLALHAQSLGFIHPKSKAFLEFCSPVPEEFLNYRLD
jgi:23S rRNA pseudouridine1911/1915/1917 synthase